MTKQQSSLEQKDRYEDVGGMSEFEGNALQGLTLERLGKCFAGYWAVRDLSLSLHAGEVYGLLGPNGAGKTTTLRMIAGLITPTEGEIRFGCEETPTEPRAHKRDIGFVTGSTGLYERLTPMETLRFFGRLHQLPSSVLEARIREMVERLGLGDFQAQACGTLSTGQKQRVNLARALLHDPPLLILDEPTSGLDILSAEFILETIRSCCAQGKIVVLSTHILSEIELLSQRIGILFQGRLLVEGTLQTLLEQTETTSLAQAFLALIHQAESSAQHLRHVQGESTALSNSQGVQS
ncbi:MAG: heme ABC exporter ATP-binding protein CcmA [Myxococcota bacterium]